METIQEDTLKALRSQVYSIQRTIGKKVIGSERIVRFMFIALLSDNHVLLEGVPGLAKTMLANEFAHALGLVFSISLRWVIALNLILRMLESILELYFL